jgi:DNA topoisomerase I
MENKILIIVESPGKIKKIGEYLGSDYIIKASLGHVMDLDKKTLSVDVNNNFKPYYIINPDKKKVVDDLKSIANICKEVILASDEDREGEMIAQSLANVLGLNNPKRIVFHEITKNAITHAINNPKTINNDMVDAQETRRILDRLMGYGITPVLWKYLKSSNNSQFNSAGRVQSVVLKIICDKENDIKKSLSESYFKTTIKLKFNDNILNGVLYHNKNIYCIQDIKIIKEFLSKINKKTDIKIINIENKKSIRKPSPPFITSTLQQEASTKLRFSVKKTMEVAQKLYEGGYITYMRTDNTNISNIIITQIKDYIIKKFTEKYSNPKEYQSKNINAQEAHECIRPTNILIENIDINPDQNKLYNLIWKRTIASQMAYCNIDNMIITVDMLNNNLSILTFNNIQTYFIINIDNIEFDGYTIIYDNNENDEEVEPNKKIDIKIEDKLIFNKLQVTEEYTKLPLRYNESLLIKYLEKHGIGRPSTYASIISKVIDRQYVSINNVDGVKKESRIFGISLLCRSLYKITETTKEVTIGKETNKLIPSEMGLTCNEFMLTHFSDIINVEFTNMFETYLDKIAIKKAKKFNVLKTFYDMFNPIVEKLLLNYSSNEESKDKLLGAIDNINIYIGEGKYGLYVRKLDENNKNKYASIKHCKDISLEKAKELLELPKILGKIGNAKVILNHSEYGYYIKYNGKNYSVKSDNNISINNIDYKSIINNDNNNNSESKSNQFKSDLKTIDTKNKTISVKNGKYGYYISIIDKTSSKSQNIPIPKNTDIEKITTDDIMSIIANKNGSLSKNL